MEVPFKVVELIVGGYYKAYKLLGSYFLYLRAVWR